MRDIEINKLPKLCQELHDAKTNLDATKGKSLKYILTTKLEDGEGPS